VAGRRPQDCFGTQRNTIDGVNVYVFAGGTIYVRLLIYQVRRCQLIRKYKDKDKERVRYRPTKRMDENSYGKIGARARKVMYDKTGRRSLHPPSRHCATMTRKKNIEQNKKLNESVAVKRE